MRNSKGQFQLGHSGGRPKGARNRLAAQVYEDILRHWCEPAAPGSKLCKGAEALETLYKDKPGEYLRLTASVLPREQLARAFVTNNDICRIGRETDVEIGQRQHASQA
jgi:hypothetical protein